MVGTAAEQTRLRVAALALAVIIDCIDAGHGNVVELLDGVFYLKFVGLTIDDKAVTVQLFALSRQLLCYYWLNYYSHLRVSLCPLREYVLNTVDKHERIGVHDGVGVDFVYRDNLDLLEIAG